MNNPAMYLRFAGAILLLFLTTYPAFCQTENDCRKFRTGQYETFDAIGERSVISRTKKYQLESTSGRERRLRILWIDDCTYKLIPAEVYKRTGEKTNLYMTITIDQIYDYGYSGRCTIGNAPEFVDIMMYNYEYVK